MQRFIMTSPIYARKTPHNHTDGGAFKVPYKVHRWLEDALKDPANSNWIPNPSRPSLLSYEADCTLKLVEDTNNKTYKTGDIIWFSFTLAFAIGSGMWAPEYRLIELVRVGSVSEDFASKTHDSAIPSVDSQVRRALQIGSTLSLIEGM